MKWMIIDLMQPPYYSKNTSEMYDAILHKPLVLRPTSSLHARQFLEGVSHRLKMESKNKMNVFTLV